MYPILEVNISKLKNNIKVLKHFLKNVEITAVLKGVNGDEIITETFINEKIVSIGESSIENIKKIRNKYGNKIEITFLRTPCESEMEEAALICDHILVSHETKIKKLKRINEKLKIIAMIDIGDYREGINIYDLESTEKIKNKIYGVGAIKGCISGKLPTVEDIYKIIKFRDNINKNFKISLGGTYFLDAMENINIKEKITFRIGEAFFTGKNPLSNKGIIKNMHGDVFRLKCEILEINNRIIEIKNKNGEIEWGKIKTALVLCGTNFLNAEGLQPEDNESRILGYTSEHMVVDISDSEEDYLIGGNIYFIPNYTNFSTYFRNFYKKIAYLSTF